MLFLGFGNPTNPKNSMFVIGIRALILWRDIFVVKTVWIRLLNLQNIIYDKIEI